MNRRLIASLAAVCFVLAPAAAVGAQSNAPASSVGDTVISIIPRPVRLTRGSGQFVVTPRTVIWTDGASAPIGRQLARYLEPATGFTLVVRSGGAAPSGAIVLRRDATLRRLGAEGYALEVRKGGVVARAPEAAGLFYAVQTMRQLLPPQVFRAAPTGGVAWTMPAVSIEDSPRFAWRGAHLDVGRHFMPKEFVRKYVDLLALHKLNTFHWHLTEDQGWRLEVKRYPRLTSVGGCRKETLIGRQQTYRDTTQWRFDATRHCGSYTQDDVREIVAYARERFVTVVPEIEMPGHALAAIASYPELGTLPADPGVGTRWGVYDEILRPDSTALRFMQNVVDEAMALFPSRYIHLGGDEAVRTQWRNSPAVQSQMRTLGLTTEAQMQAWFLAQMGGYLDRHGRRVVGWDEILEGDVPGNAVVMSWRGIQGGIAAARAGHDVVMAPGSHTYLDHYQSRDTIAEPIAIGGYLPLDTVYAYDPVPAVLSPAEAKHILGAQVQLWTEYMEGPKKVEYMAFPRLTAFAEVAWTPVARKDYADYLTRLRTHLLRLDALDVAYRRPEALGGP